MSHPRAHIGRAAQAAVTLLCVGLLALPGQAVADWLVLTDGSAIEIDGSPTPRGKMLVFKLLDGKLASLRLSEVDLDASVRRTELEERKRTASPLPAQKPEAPKEAVFVLTDADVRHVEPSSSAPAASAAGDAESPQASEQAGQRLIIRQWGQDETERGVKIFGVLENRDPNAAAALELSVTVLDDQGGVIAEQNAGLDVSTLLAGQTTRFEALFEDLPSFDSIDFEPKSVALKAGSGEGAPDVPEE